MEILLLLATSSFSSTLQLMILRKRPVRNLILLMPAFFIKAMPRTRTKLAATEQFQLALSLQRLLTSISERSQLMKHAAQAETQFLGPCMSHELGALLFTETIDHLIKTNDQPVICLLLDARSAFDLTIREIIVRNLFLKLLGIISFTLTIGSSTKKLSWSGIGRFLVQ